MAITIQAPTAFVTVEYVEGITIAQALARHLGCDVNDVVSCLEQGGQVARVGGVAVSRGMVNNVLGDGSVIGIFTEAVNNGGVKGARS